LIWSEFSPLNRITAIVHRSTDSTATATLPADDSSLPATLISATAFATFAAPTTALGLLTSAALSALIRAASAAITILTLFVCCHMCSSGFLTRQDGPACVIVPDG
jgi:hypothetical protein